MNCIDQTGKTGLIGFIADVPFGNPEQLRMAENLGAAGHSGEPEIGGVGEQRRHQSYVVVGRRSRAQMTKPLSEPRPAMHFGEKLGDAQARQHGIKPARDIFAFVVFVFADRTDRKPFCGDDRLGELAG